MVTKKLFLYWATETCREKKKEVEGDKKHI